MPHFALPAAQPCVAACSPPLCSERIPVSRGPRLPGQPGTLVARTEPPHHAASVKAAGARVSGVRGGGGGKNVVSAASAPCRA